MTEDELKNAVRYEVLKVVPQIVDQVAKQLLEVNKAMHTQFLSSSAAVMSMQNTVLESFATHAVNKPAGNGRVFTEVPQAKR